MPQIKTEQRGNVTLRYYEPHNRAPDGSQVRVYVLPGVPTDIGRVATIEDLDPNKIDGLVSSKFKPQDAERAKGIITSYVGRQVDAASILMYAEEQGKFNEFATKLEDKMRSDIHFVHPEARYARTDITAFMLGLFADLGAAPREEATNMQRQVEEVGPGLLVLLRDANGAQSVQGTYTPKANKAVDALAKKLWDMSQYPQGVEDGLTRHAVLLINVLARAEKLASTPASRDKILDRAASEGIRVALQDKDDRDTDFNKKVGLAAKLLLEDRELAVAAANMYMSRRGGDYVARDYGKVLDSILRQIPDGAATLS